MSPRIVISWLAALGLVAALVASCAVARIDVDVYKGPLANHEHVQTQQMAVMAVGAKHLLARLQEKLSDADNPLLWKTVEATLTLFDNQGDELAAIRDKGREAFEKYLEAVRILDEKEPPPQLIYLRKELNEVGNAASPLRELAKAFGNFLVPDRSKENQFRKWQPIFKEIRDLADAEKQTILGELNSDMLPDQDAPRLDSSNGAYKQLQDDQFLRRIAQRFLPDNRPMQDNFVREVKRIALSFTEARQALEKVLIWALRGLSVSDDVKFRSESLKQRLIGEVAKVVARIIQTEHLRLAIDDPGTSLINELRTRLEAEMGSEIFSNFEMWDDERNKGTSRNIEFFLQLVIQKNPVRISRVLLETHEKFVTPLRLAHNSTLGAYGNAKEKCTAKGITVSIECIKAHYGASARRQYGLADGPVLGEQEKRNLKEIYERAAETLDRALPLGSGRLSDGLDTLTEDYLRATKEESLKPCESRQPCPDQRETNADRKRRVLLDALVGFAEKILFIANHEGLLEPSPEGESIDLETKTYVRVLQAVGNSILIQADELQYRDAHRRGLKDAKDREAQALTANPHKVLDNLIQELKARAKKESGTRLTNAVEKLEEHRKDALKGLYPPKDDVTPSAAILLLRTVLRKAQIALESNNSNWQNDSNWQKYRDALEVLDEPAMSATATTPLAGNSKTSKDALDQLIAALRHEHVQAVRLYGENSATAKNAKAALAATYEHRSGMVYIRPSGVYLRSSYPATSLQGDPRLGWENMLAAHSLRSTPLVGGLLANAGERENLKIQSEIDKQFWQNINSVRVTGAGRTNYVIAKDDIGNWYVKKYSSDPQDIIQSAKNLALFGIGSQLNTNLVRRVREQEQRAAGQPVTPQRPPLARVLDQETEAYDARTKSHYDALQSALADGGIAITIRTAWESIAETSALGTDKKSSLLNQIAPAYGETLKPVHGDLASNAGKKDERANRILTGLDALLRFHKALREKIAALDLTKEAAEKLKAEEKKKSAADTKLEEVNKKLVQTQIDLLKAQNDLDSLSADADRTDPTKKRDVAQRNVTAVELEVKQKKTAVEAAAKAVDEAKTTLEKAKGAEIFVLGEVTRIVRGEILKVAGQRVNAVEKLEAATVFIGNATKAQ